MAFTALDVKKLREMTNVGMMDCKKGTGSDLFNSIPSSSTIFRIITTRLSDFTK